MNHIKMTIIILSMLAISLLSAGTLKGIFNQSNLTILTQGDRFIGYELHQSLKFPWQPEATYKSIEFPTIKGGSILFPDGMYHIFNTIE